MYYGREAIDAGGAAMIDHVSVAVSDLPRAMRFYEAVLGAIGYTMVDIRGTTVGFGKKYSEFWINVRPDMRPLPPHSGAHICLRAALAGSGRCVPAAALATAAPPTARPACVRMTGGRLLRGLHPRRRRHRIEAVTFFAG
jgi:hypothetical protein